MTHKQTCSVYFRCLALLKKLKRLIGVLSKAVAKKFKLLMAHVQWLLQHQTQAHCVQCTSFKEREHLSVFLPPSLILSSLYLIPPPLSTRLLLETESSYVLPFWLLLWPLNFVDQDTRVCYPEMLGSS